MTKKRPAKKTEAQDIASPIIAFKGWAGRNRMPLLVSTFFLGCSTIIVANAAFMQTKKHPAPIMLGMVDATTLESAPVVPKPRARQEKKSTSVILPKQSIGSLLVTPQKKPHDANKATPQLKEIIFNATQEKAENSEQKAELVRTIQQVLKTRGYYSGLIDGLKGGNTKSAIQLYQKAFYLKISGEPSEELLQHISLSTSDKAAHDLARARIKDDSYVPGDFAKLSAQDRVADVQRALSELGYGALLPDGLMGAKTSTAIRRFQQDHGLNASGKVNEEIVNKLIKLQQIRPL